MRYCGGADTSAGSLPQLTSHLWVRFVSVTKFDAGTGNPKTLIPCHTLYRYTNLVRDQLDLMIIFELFANMKFVISSDICPISKTIYGRK